MKIQFHRYCNYICNFHGIFHGPAFWCERYQIFTGSAPPENSVSQAIYCKGISHFDRVCYSVNIQFHGYFKHICHFHRIVPNSWDEEIHPPKIFLWGNFTGMGQDHEISLVFHSIFMGFHHSSVCSTTWNYEGGKHWCTARLIKATIISVDNLSKVRMRFFIYVWG